MWKRLKKELVADFRQVYFQDEARSAEPTDEEAWYLAAALPPLRPFVHPALRVALFPGGQRGVEVTEDLERGTLLIASNPVIFQGPLAEPKAPGEAAGHPIHRPLDPSELKSMSN